MFKRYVDLSISIENNPYSDPPPTRPHITYIDHQASVPQLAHVFPGIQPSDLPEGEAWAVESIQLSSHSGTHLDAPYHYASTMDEGKRALTIDEIPLDWCFRPGVKLDFSHFEDGYVLMANDLKTALAAIDYTLKPLDIVLIQTRAGQVYGSEAYLHAGCGVGEEGTLYLLEQGVKVTGTDAWSWDAPFSHTAKKYAETKNPKLIWEGHKAGRKRAFCHLEKLHNLDQLPSHGFYISCFPVKIHAASAGWTRAVALFS